MFPVGDELLLERLCEGSMQRKVSVLLRTARGMPRSECNFAATSAGLPCLPGGPGDYCSECQGLDDAFWALHRSHESVSA